MKLYTSTSLAEKQRMVERNELELLQLHQLELLQQQLMQQELIQAQLLEQQIDLLAKDAINMRDNETKILIAEMLQANQDDGIIEPEFSEEAKANLLEKIREFDLKLKLDRERLAFDKDKAKTDAELKRKLINKKPNTSK